MTKNTITSSSAAEYFSKNLQQVGFSSPIKAVLTTLKESVDNALDACESYNILPEISVEISRISKGTTKNSDLIEIKVTDNGPGIDPTDLAKVFGEYLASSKFGRGQCSRGQQGIGISAAVTWAQLTNAKGVVVTTKTKRMRKAIKALVNVNIKGNEGIIKKKETIDWHQDHGTCVLFRIDGKVQLKGDGGLITYLEGTILVNPHLTLQYKLLDNETVHAKRVSDEIPKIPEPTLPHPHTMKLGEFMSHAHLHGKVQFRKFLRTGFSRITDQTIKELIKNGFPRKVLDTPILKLTQDDYKKCFQVIQEANLMSPSTRSVLRVGEEALSKSIQRLGLVDFFSVVARRPCICDSKPVVVEVAIARFKNRGGEADDPVQLLRFANRVPLQFDKSSCAITKAIETVNWRSYGLQQPKGSIPLGPYVVAVSMVSPFIKFKNASKETIDASDELVEEIRRAVMQAGQRLSRHIKKEDRESALEKKLQHIEKFGPLLISILGRITKSPAKRIKKAEAGLKKILGRDTKEAKKDLAEAAQKLDKLHERHTHLTVDSKPEEQKPEEQKSNKKTKKKGKHGTTKGKKTRKRHS